MIFQHNNNMQSLLLIIVVFFLLVLIVPIFVKFHLSYDIINNLGTLSVYIFFIRIILFKIRVKNKNIVLVTQKDQKEVETEISEKQIRFLNQLTTQLKQKLIVRKLYAYSRIGTGDAGSSAILTGLFNSIVGCVLASIKNVKKSARIGTFSEPSYNEKHLTFSLYGSFMITIFDILYSIVMSLAIVKRSEKYERV